MVQIYLIITLLIIQFVVSMRNLMVVLIYLKHNNLIENISNQGFNGRLFIVIPCLRETTVIEQTLKYFSKVLRSEFNAKIVVVTTERENIEKQEGLSMVEDLTKDICDGDSVDSLYSKYNHIVDYKTIEKLVSYFKTNRLIGVAAIEFVQQRVKCALTTPQLIEEIISNNMDMSEKIIHLHYSKSNCIMADQLNFAMNWLEENMGACECDYYCLYNADSKPSPKTFDAILNIIKNNNYPQVIQQYSCAFSNINNVNWLLKGLAVYQTNFELRQGLINAYNKKKFSYRYIVGHGLIIRFDTLLELNGFDNSFWCEDICLSNVLIQKNIPIIPLPIIEEMEIPQNISTIIKQNAVWFSTALKAKEISKHNKEIHNNLSCGDWQWIFCRKFLNFSWLTYPFIIIGIALFAFLSSVPWLGAVEIAIFIFSIFVTYFPTIILSEKLSGNRIKHSHDAGVKQYYEQIE